MKPINSLNPERLLERDALPRRRAVPKA